MRAPFEADVDADGGRAEWLGVVVRAEALLPEAVRRARRGGRHRLRIDALDLQWSVVAVVSSCSGGWWWLVVVVSTGTWTWWWLVAVGDWWLVVVSGWW